MEEGLQVARIALDNAEDIAIHLYLHAISFNLSKLGDYLSQPGPFAADVLSRLPRRLAVALSDLDRMLSFFDFVGKGLDQAIRAYLSKFRLPGEAQKIDRLMEAFARRYHRCNPELFPGSDTAYVLAFSVIMWSSVISEPGHWSAWSFILLE